MQLRINLPWYQTLTALCLIVSKKPAYEGGRQPSHTLRALFFVFFSFLVLRLIGGVCLLTYTGHFTEVCRLSPSILLGRFATNLYMHRHS